MQNAGVVLPMSWCALLEISAASTHHSRVTGDSKLLNQVAELRFFFVKTLKRHQFRDFLPYPENQRRPRTVSSQEEVSSDQRSRHVVSTDAADDALWYRDVALRTDHLKVGDIDSQRMIIRVVAGKRGKDRDLPLSPALLETLREYWRWREPKLCLFPTRTLERSLDQPISDKTVWIACTEAALRSNLCEIDSSPAIELDRAT